jgi:hypothetical protein
MRGFEQQALPHARDRPFGRRAPLLDAETAAAPGEDLEQRVFPLSVVGLGVDDLSATEVDLPCPAIGLHADEARGEGQARHLDHVFDRRAREDPFESRSLEVRHGPAVCKPRASHVPL